ncbi:MAG: hypothetical protein ACAI37_07900 [Chthoniobacter sp.]
MAEPTTGRPTDAEDLESLLSAIDNGFFDTLDLTLNRVLLDQPESGDIWLCAAVAAMAAPRSFVPGAEGDFLKKALTLQFDRAVAERILEAVVRSSVRFARSRNFSKAAECLRFAYRIGEVPEMPEVFRKLWEGHCLEKAMKGDSDSTMDAERRLRLLSKRFREDHPEWDIPIIEYEKKAERRSGADNRVQVQPKSGPDSRPKEPRTSAIGIAAGIIISLLMSAMGGYLAATDGGWLGMTCVFSGLWFLVLCIREVSRRQRKPQHK